MDATQALAALADALDAASASLRQSLALHAADGGAEPGSPAGSAVDRAKALHPQLGPRQAEVLTLLEKAGNDGTTTGAISRAIGYDQPNVYLTLRGLMTLNFVEKDATTSPHTYRLTPLLLDEVP